MPDETFAEFKQRLLDRHTNQLTSKLSTLADVLALAAVPLGLVTRDPRVLGGLAAAAFVVATGAHLFQPGTVRDELFSVFRRPIWATRAELGRVFGRR